MSRRAQLAISWLALSLLVGCHATASTTAASPTPQSQPAIGFVRVDDLLRLHPLSSDVAVLDRQISTLTAALQSQARLDDLADVRATQQQFHLQLEQAAKHAQQLLNEQGRALTEQEHAQISALLSRQPQPSVAPNFAAAIEAQTLDYHQRLDGVKRSALHTLASNLTARDQRLLANKRTELSRQETDDALKMAQADAPERLGLQTKAALPGLSQAQQHELAQRLTALDAREASARQAEHAAHEQSLQRLEISLGQASQREYSYQAGRIQRENTAQLVSRGAITQGQLQALQLGNATPPSASRAALLAKIHAIHTQFQAQFQRDSQASVAAFRATRASFQARFDGVVRTHLAAQKALLHQLQALEARRAALHAQMMSQIERKTRRVAESAGVGLVMSDVLAHANAVDLTPQVARTLIRTP